MQKKRKGFLSRFPLMRRGYRIHHIGNGGNGKFD